MVEIIPKKAPPLPRWLNLLFYFSLVLIVFSISSYFILNKSLEKGQKTLADSEEALAKLGTPEKIALEKEILKYQKKTEDFSQISKEHLKDSEIFTILQKNCHPKVWFSQFNFNTKDGNLNLAGETQSFESLGQQLLIFKGEDSIKSVDLEKVSISKEGKIVFNLTLSFNPKIFK